MTATPEAVDVKQPVAVPQAPPSDRVSSARQKTAPNWALKTAMAGTGALLSLLLVAGLIVNLWFFMLYRSWRMIVTIGDLQTTQRPLWPTTPMLLSGGLIVLVLIAVHAVIAVVLMLRSRKGRGAVPAKLHGGLHAVWTKSMPVTGLLIGLLTVAYLIQPVRFELTGTVECRDPGTCTTTSLGLALTTSMPAWLAITLYIVALVVVCIHVMHGLGTVATIAAGNGVLLGQIKRWVVLLGGVVLVLLVAANIVVPLVTWMGWF